MPRSKLGEVLATVKGFSMQALRPEYRDEEKQYGWRADAKLREKKRGESDAEYDEYVRRAQDPLLREQLRESQVRTTKHFSDAERDAARIDFDAKGRGRGKFDTQDDGTMRGQDFPLKGRKAEFVADADGTLYQFEQKVPKTGVEVHHPVSGKKVDQTVATHHSSVLAGDEVSAAGEIEFDYDGYVKRITNKSGHYRPGAAQVIQLLEELARKGALLDGELKMLGADGTVQPLSGKALEVYSAVRKVEKTVKDKLVQGQPVEAELAAIRQAKQALAKLGAGPANKMREVEVEFLDGAAGKTGIAVREGVGSTSKAGDFLRTGGGATSVKPEARPDAAKVDHSSRGGIAVDLDEFPVALIAASLNLSVAQVEKCLQAEGAVVPDFMFDFSDVEQALQAQGLHSGGDIQKRLHEAGRLSTAQQTIAVTRPVAERKKTVLGELTKQSGAKRQALDDDAQAAADALAQRIDEKRAQCQASLELLAKAVDDKSVKLRKLLEDSLARLEAAKAQPRPDDQKLAQLLDGLDKFIVKKQPVAGPSIEALADAWRSTCISTTDFSLAEIAKRLGLEVHEVRDLEDGGLVFPEDLLNGFAGKMGTPTLVDLYKKFHQL